MITTPRQAGGRVAERDALLILLATALCGRMLAAILGAHRTVATRIEPRALGLKKCFGIVES